MEAGAGGRRIKTEERGCSTLLIRGMDLKIWVESEQEKWSTFFFTPAE
jgi:hypothetical protein